MTLPFQMSATELAGLRADLEAYTLPDTCVIQTLSQVSDGAGGLVDSWTPAATVACRMDWKSGFRKVVGSALESFTGWMLTVPQTTAITTSSRVVHAGKTYKVSEVSDLGSWIACKRALLERLGP